MVKVEKKHVTFDLVFVGECPMVASHVEEEMEKFVITSDIRVQRIVSDATSAKIWAVAFTHGPRLNEVKKLIHERGFEHARFEHAVAAKKSGKLAHAYHENSRPRDFYGVGTIANDSDGSSFVPVITRFFKDDGDGRKRHWLKMWKEVKSTMKCTRSDTFLIVER